MFYTIPKLTERQEKVVHMLMNHLSKVKSQVLVPEAQGPYVVYEVYAQMDKSGNLTVTFQGFNGSIAYNFIRDEITLTLHISGGYEAQMWSRTAKREAFDPCAILSEYLAEKRTIQYLFAHFCNTYLSAELWRDWYNPQYLMKVNFCKGKVIVEVSEQNINPLYRVEMPPYKLLGNTGWLVAVGLLDALDRL